MSIVEIAAWGFVILFVVPIVSSALAKPIVWALDKYWEPGKFIGDERRVKIFGRVCFAAAILIIAIIKSRNV